MYGLQNSSSRRDNKKKCRYCRYRYLALQVAFLAWATVASCKAWAHVDTNSGERPHAPGESGGPPPNSTRRAIRPY
jgi:hypothetical protein